MKRGSKRCENCEGCSRRNDCLECKECRDKKVNGGPGILKMCCRLKKCQSSKNKNVSPHNLETGSSPAVSSVPDATVAVASSVPDPTVAAPTPVPDPKVPASTPVPDPKVPVPTPVPTVRLSPSVPDLPADSLDCPPPKRRIKRAQLLFSPQEDLVDRMSFTAYVERRSSLFEGRYARFASG